MLKDEERELLRRDYINPFHQIPFNESKKTYEVVGCSDILQVDLKVSPVEEVSAYFAGEGCQLCLSSASLMCRLIEGLNLKEICELLEEVKGALFQGTKIKRFRELNFLLSFHERPNRKHCAALAWESLEKEIQTKL